MPESITIPTQYTDTAFDYNALRQQAMAFIQARSGEVWTDHNVHDPGITMMELLCFAITDLSYRAALPIENLIAQPGATGLPKPMYTAAAILPSRPLTNIDYRKLCIDTSVTRDSGAVCGIKNAWLQKRSAQAFANFTDKKLSHQPLANNRAEKVSIKGFYDVLIEFDADATKAEKEALVTALRQKLHQHRNLCEDFVDISQIENAPFRICAEIEIAEDADPFEVLSAIYVNLQQYLSPIVRFYNLKAMQQAGFAADEIFDGPRLEQGFLKSDDLMQSALRRDIRLSDVIQQIFKIAGVQNAVDVVLQATNVSGKPEEKWVLPAPEGRKPVLDLATSRVVLYKNGIPFVPDAAKVMAMYLEKMTALQADARSAKADDLPYPIGQPLPVEDYTSIQHHFPKTYGIGNWGLNDAEPDERKVKALQLHGYLWVMDQLMGDYLAQLSQLPALLGSQSIGHTQYVKLVYQFNQSKKVLTELRTDAANLPNALLTLQETLQALVETEQEFFKRRHALLDHLISRFAEDFAGYVYTHDALFPATSPAVLIAQKEAFLNNYPAISRHRGGAHHYGLATGVWDTDNISGFELRARHMLGIAEHNRQTAVKLYTKLFPEPSGDGNTVFRFAYVAKAGSTALISTASFATDEACLAEAEVVELLATDRVNYGISELGGEFLLSLSDKTPAVVAQCPQLFSTKTEAEDFLDALLAKMAAPVDEALLVIEHLLLLPTPAAEAWLNICVDGNCEDCDDLDPYSFRLSIVLPANAGRFANMSFRQFAEQLLRREVSAHLLPKICWVHTEAYGALEDALHNWLLFKAGVLPPDQEQESLVALLAALQNCKNVYPKARLQDCSSTVQKQLLVLNKASLGNLKNS
jgi:hypothetical protein